MKTKGGKLLRCEQRQDAARLSNKEEEIMNTQNDARSFFRLFRCQRKMLTLTQYVIAIMGRFVRLVKRSTMNGLRTMSEDAAPHLYISHK